MLEIAKGVHIDEAALVFHASRSSGPGGQNVNKVSTRVTVQFDVRSCPTLTDEQKARIFARLKSRITSEGVLQVTCQDYRSQPANRRAAAERLVELLSGALFQLPPRKPTRTPYRARARRLEAKARRSSVKKLRSSTDMD
jgi:ribosome-associated protein